MNLHQDPFCEMQSGKKTIEVRLNDEKRRKLHEGDTIIFTNRDNPDEQFSTRVKTLLLYPTFNDMFNALGNKHRPHHTEESFGKSLRSYYTTEDEENYGTVAIEVELM